MFKWPTCMPFFTVPKVKFSLSPLQFLGEFPMYVLPTLIDQLLILFCNINSAYDCSFYFFILNIMKLLTKYMYIRVAKKNSYFREKFHDQGQRKLEWRRVRKYIRFLILFIPRSSICKKNLIADFRKLYYTTFLMNLHHFPYFDPTKKSAKKIV